MRKIFYAIAVLLAVVSCENQDIEFDDFEFQAVYFPHQTPLRTIMLGDEVIGDNSIDRDHAFTIGAAIGGLYENSKNRELTIELAPDLTNNITDADGNALQILPANYYNATLENITIPKGSHFGKVRVDLTDDFFNDPLSIGLNYVIPVRITAAQDSILQGDPATDVLDPDPRVSSDWNITPKDYVLFGIKYINPTHGAYLLRGKRVNLTDTNEDPMIYSQRFLDDNEVVKLATSSLTDSFMTTVGGTNKTSANDDFYSLKLTFDEANKTVAVSQKSGTTVVASGTGVYYSKDDDKSEGYNGKKHRTIYLDYTYDDNGNTYQVNDSLVFLDTEMTFEDFAVNVVIP